MSEAKTKYERTANSIEGLVTSLNYSVYTPIELETLILLTNYIRVIPSDEISAFRIKKLTESHNIFKRLKEGYSTRTVKETVKELLIEYEHYEVLAELDF